MNSHSGNLSPDKLNPRAAPFVPKKASPFLQDATIPNLDLQRLNKNAQPFEPKKINKEINKDQINSNIKESYQYIKSNNYLISDGNYLSQEQGIRIDFQAHLAHSELLSDKPRKNITLTNTREDKIPENTMEYNTSSINHIIPNSFESTKNEIIGTEKQQMIHIDKDDLFNAFLPLSKAISINEVSESQAIITEEKEDNGGKSENEFKSESKIYDIEYLLSFKKKWTKLPYHMNFVDIPIRSKNTDFPIPPIIPPQTEFNPVKEIRILLNTIAEENYEKIADKIVNEFEYNINTLDALAKLLFNKSIKEPNYVDLYLRLCKTLFKKFKTHHEEMEDNAMNFRKLFISRVQNLFQGEDEEKGIIDNLPNIIDNEEKQYKKRQKIFGNIRLIGELFVRGLIDDRVLKLCFKRLLSRKKMQIETELKIIEEKIENACILFKRISDPILTYFYLKAEEDSIEIIPKMDSNNPQSVIPTQLPPKTGLKLPKLSIKEMTLDYFEKYFDRLIDFQLDPEISSRIKFMIQDIIDLREVTLSKFKFITEVSGKHNQSSFNINFNSNPIPNPNPNPNPNCNSNKNPITNNLTSKKEFHLNNHIESGKIDQQIEIKKEVSSESKDGDTSQLKAIADKGENNRLEENKLLEKKLDNEIKRKESLDEGNVIGVNLEPYRKQSIDNRLKIQNLINEYIASGDKNEALVSFKEFKEISKIESFTSFGLLINDCICRKQSEFEIISLLVYDIISLKMVSDEEITQSILIVFAKLYDNLIDFPYSKSNFLELLNRMKDLSQGVSKNFLTYQNHISEVEKQ